MEQAESNKHKQVCHNKQNSEYLRSFPGRGMFKQQSFFDLTFCSFWYAFSSAILSQRMIFQFYLSFTSLFSTRQSQSQTEMGVLLFGVFQTRPSTASCDSRRVGRSEDITALLLLKQPVCC